MTKEFVAIRIAENRRHKAGDDVYRIHGLTGSGDRDVDAGQHQITIPRDVSDAELGAAVRMALDRARLSPETDRTSSDQASLSEPAPLRREQRPETASSRRGAKGPSENGHGATKFRRTRVSRRARVHMCGRAACA
jgi:hypothetical protein